MESDYKDSPDYQRWLEGWNCHIDTHSREKNLLIRDAQEALSYLVSTGFTVEKALQLTDPSNLGGFYAHPQTQWYPLDDAAKIYPLSMKYGQMPLFRLACTLKEKVIPQILQLALDFTVKRFPAMSTVVRKGFFWHYLDSVKTRPAVTSETEVPCRPMKISQLGTRAMKVMYWDSRISVEFFHVLTDASGGLEFLKSLVGTYLRILGKDIPMTEKPFCNSIVDSNSIPYIEETYNEFERLDPKTASSGGFAGKPALQMSGKLCKVRPCRVIHFKYSTEELLAAARQRNTTITCLLLSMMFVSHRAATEGTDGVVKIQVPVNMRKYYETLTLRNFSMYCSIDIAASQIHDADSLIPEISKQLCNGSSKETMSVMMTTSHRLVRSLRFFPRALKAPVAQVIYGFLGDTIFSNTLSNLGNIKLPQEVTPFIEDFDFTIGTGSLGRAMCSACSFNGTTVLTITKATKDPSFEEAMLKESQRLGLKVHITGSAQ